MYAVGHLAIGYLSGKATAKLAHVNVNVPVMFTLAILPDIDLLIPRLAHRGPTHSLIVLALLFVPVFLLYKKRAIPYFAALILHPLIGDILTGGAQLLWPLTTTEYGLRLDIANPANILTEWTFFLASLALLYTAKDLHTLFQRHRSNLFLLIPIFTVLLPTFLMFPIYVPRELIIPHLIYLTIFTLSILVDLKPKPAQKQ